MNWTVPVALEMGVTPRPSMATEQIVMLCRNPDHCNLSSDWFLPEAVELKIVGTARDALWCLANTAYARQTLLVDGIFSRWPGLVPFSELKEIIPRLRIILIQEGGIDVGRVAEMVGADVGISQPLDRLELLEALETRRGDAGTHPGNVVPKH